MIDVLTVSFLLESPKMKTLEGRKRESPAAQTGGSTLTGARLSWKWCWPQPIVFLTRRVLFSWPESRRLDVSNTENSVAHAKAESR